MNNLVISVSHDSSLELLGKYADILILDKDAPTINNKHYDSVYIRSHFSRAATVPQNFRVETNDLVRQVRRINPAVTFIDHMDTVDAIIAFEDKWLQYQRFREYMPLTALYDEKTDSSLYTRPIYKKRLSSRSTGVTWDQNEAVRSKGDWIIQESIDIQEELRVYVILGEVYPIATVRQHKTKDRELKAMTTRDLTQAEINFSLSIAALAPNLDIIGVDVAKTANGTLMLIEVNRSPGFAKFYEFTGINLADKLFN